MKKNLFISITLLLCCMLLPAALQATPKYQDPFSLYRDTYFIAGDKESQVKFQLSTKINILFPFETGVYMGYTQKSLWHLYEPSSPFIETNYQPEAFYRFENKNNLWDIEIPALDYIQVSPIAHMSNGRDEEESRSINRYYLEAQISHGSIYNFGINIQAFNYYKASLDNNPNIADYSGYASADIFFRLRSKYVEYLDKEEIHIKFGGASLDRSWLEVTFQVRILTSKIQPKFYFQMYHGYGEFLIFYDKKETAFRAGLGF